MQIKSFLCFILRRYIFILTKSERMYTLERKGREKYMLSPKELLSIKKFACEVRIETLVQIATRGFGHLPGSFSVVDALALLYEKHLRYKPEDPKWEDRDYLIMSKGHAGPALYTCLALKGFFPKEWLLTLNQPHTKLPSHCDRLLTPGIDMTAGSLGQGISAALGVALAKKMNKQDSKVYCFVGDGECNEGQVWEALLFASHHQLDNFILLVDRNWKQLDGSTEDVLALGNLAQKIQSFDFEVETVDGHDLEQLDSALQRAKINKIKPYCIVLNTIKGKGLPVVEAMALNHHIQIDKGMADTSLALLQEKLAEIKDALVKLS